MDKFFAKKPQAAGTH
jgi:hypothetical protein